jgi:hypothetical protein
MKPSFLGLCSEFSAANSGIIKPVGFSLGVSGPDGPGGMS